MGYDDHDKFSADVMRLNETHRRFVINVTVRLADIDWLSQTLDEHVRQGGGPPVKVGLLSLQIYLLLTCADILGHITVGGRKAGKRFKAFFQDLPPHAQQHLVKGYLVWKTDWGELLSLGLADPSTGLVTSPQPSAIERSVRALSHKKRLAAVIDFLYYICRTPYTHEGDYPGAGYHPILYVLQMHRLQVPQVVSFDEYDRLQAAVDGETRYFVVYNTKDPIAELRRVVLQGFGAIVRGAQT
jgi:hypothetical protein